MRKLRTDPRITQCFNCISRLSSSQWRMHGAVAAVPDNPMLQAAPGRRSMTAESDGMQRSNRQITAHFEVSERCTTTTCWSNAATAATTRRHLSARTGMAGHCASRILIRDLAAMRTRRAVDTYPQDADEGTYAQQTSLYLAVRRSCHGLTM